MTAGSGSRPTAPPSCWCCGEEFPESELVRLGAHPEVALCLGCANRVQRRAAMRRHEQHPSIAAHLPGGVHTVRGKVIERGWHERGRLGALLQRIDRHLP